MDLTPREREVARRIAHGRSSKQIAAELGITFRTVVTHRFRIFKKLGVTNTAELVGQAVRMGLVDFRTSVGISAADGVSVSPSNGDRHCPTSQSVPRVGAMRLSGNLRTHGVETNRLRLEFLSTEFNLCNTFLEFARMNDTGKVQRAAVDAAEHGYRTIHRFLHDPKHALHLTGEQLTTLCGKMHQLRKALDDVLPRGGRSCNLARLNSRASDTFHLAGAEHVRAAGEPGLLYERSGPEGA
ncbi:MAG TPA: LuxR C-terminal-related transcriptional regulator [Bryobacteraceae bacterium]